MVEPTETPTYAFPLGLSLSKPLIGMFKPSDKLRTTGLFDAFLVFLTWALDQERTTHRLDGGNDGPSDPICDTADVQGYDTEVLP